MSRHSNHNCIKKEYDTQKAKILNIFIPKLFHRQILHCSSSSNHHTNVTLADIEINVTGIEKLFKLFDSGMATGSDGIPIKFYTDYAKVPLSVLAAVYQRSLEDQSISKD